MKKILKYLSLSLILLVLLVSTAQAKFVVPTVNNTGLPGDTDINTVIRNVVQWFLALVAIIALVVIVWAGVTYMTAGGDEDKITKAKTRLTYGILGVVVAIAGLVIVIFIYNIVQGNNDLPNGLSL